MREKIAAFGIFSSNPNAENCVSACLDAGFSRDDVSLLATDPARPSDLVSKKATKAPEGAAAGGTTGGAIGGILGLLAGAGALAIPGLGPFIAAGPIIGALAGFGAGAASGGLLGALIGMDVPEYEAKRYVGDIEKGGVLLSIHCASEERVKKAKVVLEKCGATAISIAGEAKVGDAG